MTWQTRAGDGPVGGIASGSARGIAAEAPGLQDAVLTRQLRDSMTAR